jgi:hypothetical protein
MYESELAVDGKQYYAGRRRHPDKVSQKYAPLDAVGQCEDI